MENQEQQRACDNCLKLFSCDKIDLHQAYCFRNIKKCPKCSKMIDINDQQAHDSQQHTNKQCQLCKQEFSPLQFQSHPQKCPRKPLECQFCQNTYAQIQLFKHKQSCGSRTKPCELCQKLVMIKEMNGHVERCRQRAQERQRNQRERSERHQRERHDRERNDRQRHQRERNEISQDAVRNHHHRNNQNSYQPHRERQNSQNVIRDRRISSTNKNNVQAIIPKPAKVKPSHMIGPESIKPPIDPVPISIRMAMKVKEQQRLPKQEQRFPLKSKN